MVSILSLSNPLSSFSVIIVSRFMYFTSFMPKWMLSDSFLSPREGMFFLSSAKF